MKKSAPPSPVLNKIRNSLSQLRWQNFLLLIAAGTINAIGVTMFLAPVHLYDSGISGTSMLLWQVTPPAFTLSLFLVLLNVPLFLFGLKKQGLCFTIYSIWAVFIYSGVSFLINEVLPVDVATASPFAGSDLLLCAIFGGLISGITPLWASEIEPFPIRVTTKRLPQMKLTTRTNIPRRAAYEQSKQRCRRICRRFSYSAPRSIFRRRIFSLFTQQSLHRCYQYFRHDKRRRRRDIQPSMALKYD